MPRECSTSDYEALAAFQREVGRVIVGSDFEALAAFHREVGHLIDLTDDAMQAAGLDRLMFLVLMALQRRGAAMTIDQLAESLRLDRRLVVDLVDALVRRAFVARESDTTDRRRALISLTTAGSRWLVPLVDAQLEQLNCAGPALLQALRAVLAHAALGRPTPARADLSEFAWRTLGAPPV